MKQCKVICELPAVPPGEIMFISAFKADRLQVNLQLVVNCLKLLEKKKGTGFNLPTSPKPESRSKMGFDNFMPPDLPDVKPQVSLSIDPCGSEEVDFEDLNRRLEILKKTTKFLGLGLSN
ncbi:IST1 homolog [Panthera leo]|uniref:IST1 homolog n=1 Tax=Panthera leo TaxID=9689 RepID=UPI001C69B262|nr:IST1 homolog [Panthera leo]